MNNDIIRNKIREYEVEIDKIRSKIRDLKREMTIITDEALKNMFDKPHYVLKYREHINNNEDFFIHLYRIESAKHPDTPHPYRDWKSIIATVSEEIELAVWRGKTIVDVKHYKDISEEKTIYKS